jgi:hypothetical protein
MVLGTRTIIRAALRRYAGGIVKRRLMRDREVNAFADLVDIAEDTYSVIYFNNDAWQSGVEDILQETENKVVESKKRNKHWLGQHTILIEYFTPKARRVLEDGRGYDPEEFIETMRHELDDYYYYAVNILIEECASELQYLYDAIVASQYANGGFLIGNEVFSYALTSPFYTPGRMYSSNAAAFRNYESNMLAKGYRIDDTPAARRHNSELNRQKLIASTGPAGSKWRSGAKSIGIDIPYNYYSDMQANGFRIGNSYADHKYNSDLKRQRLIERTGPKGTPTRR